MRGHVRREGNAWYVIVDLPRDPVTGKRKQKWHSGFKTRKDAERALTDILSRLDQGTYVAPTKQTVAQYLDEWLPAVKSTVRPSTYSTYVTICASHLKPRIGSIPLRSLTTLQLNGLYNDLLTDGRVNGKGGLAPASIRYVHAVIRKALGDAVRASILPRNPAEGARPPRVPRKQIGTWSAREVRTFLDHVKDDRFYAAYVLACTTGMRRGEVAAIRWQDLDLDTCRLSVTRSLTVVGGWEVQVSEPKTARGRRMIALDGETVRVLHRHRDTQAVERDLMGDAYEDGDFVFCRADGSPIHPDMLTEWFYRHTKAAKLPRIRFHDLRHTHATLALSAGVHPKVVSERLGHASVVITLDTYSHSIPAMQEEAASKVASLLFG